MAALARTVRAAALLVPRPAWDSAAAGRRRVRALRRSPVRVLPSIAQAREQQLQKGVLPGARPTPKPRARPGPAEKAPQEAQEPKEQEVELRYERAGPGDKRLSKVVTIAKSRAFRERHGKILLEGQRLITDALVAGAVPQMLFFSNLGSVKELPVAKLKKASLIKVKFEDLKAWSDVIAPQGVIGIFSRPDHSKMTYPEVKPQHMLPLSLICDNVRDPGNLGTILRSAAGAGCSKVLLVKGCVDAWEPKVLRAGMGAHFRLPVISNLEWEVVPNYLLPGSCVHVADSFQAEAEPVGPAASDHGWVSSPYHRQAKMTQSDSSSSNAKSAQEEELLLLESCHYSEQWTDGPTALVIGGETLGVSTAAQKLAESTGGRRLHIPVVPGVDSLNCAMAASILLFEAKRQLQLLPGTSHTAVLQLNA